jgi:hypothetical protein
MADPELIELEKGEVKFLPARRHAAATPLIARTDENIGSGEELLVITPGKDGLRLIPNGSKFLGYEPETELPIFELPDGKITDWHEQKPAEPEAPAPKTATSTKKGKG